MKLKDRLAKLRADMLKKKPKVTVFADAPNTYECRNLHCRARLVGKGSVYVTTVDDPQYGHQVMNMCRTCAAQINSTRKIAFRINLNQALGVVPLTRDYGPIVK